MSAVHPDMPGDDDEATPPDGTPVPPPAYDGEEKTQEMSREDLQHIFQDIAAKHGGTLPSDED